MLSIHSKIRMGPMLMLALSLLSWQTVFAGVPLGVDAEGGKVPTLAPLLKEVTAGVVNIAVRGHVAAQPNPLFDDPFFRRFFGVPEQQQPQQQEFRAAGSGVIVDARHGRWAGVRGVEVLEIRSGSRAWEAGLRKGDVITSVNRQAVETPQALGDAARANPDVLLLSVRRGDGALFIAIR